MTTHLSTYHPHEKWVHIAQVVWRMFLRFLGVAVWLLLAITTLAISYLVLRYIAWPGYVDPQSRMYTSSLGYAALLRQEGTPLPVKTATPLRGALSQYFTGEGFVRSQPVLVPIVPLGRITRVHADVGDEVRQGDLLIELDKTQARLRLDAAKVAWEIAQAELSRTKIGTVYVLGQEQPVHDAIDATSAKEQAQIKKELDRRAEELYREKLISKEQLLHRKLENIQISAEVEKAEVSLQKSQLGHKQSIRIAEAEVRAAALAFEQRQAELAEHDIYAPADGIIERRLVNEGEYNQDPGRPALVLAVGRWFEAHYDQTVIGRIAPGDSASVNLEAFAGEAFDARVTLVQPIVTFTGSGPEVTRPIRPSGTGAPEWPSSFPVRFELKPRDLPVAIGLSGFARVRKSILATFIPSQSVVSRSAGTGIVYVARGAGFEKKQVVLGDTVGRWTEVRAGLEEDDRVIVDGHYALFEGDLITAEEADDTLRAQWEADQCENPS